MSKSDPNTRHQRYQAIVNVVVERDSFGLSEIKALCPQEQPAYVTRVVKQLAKEGWLVCEAKEGAYRWSHRRVEFSADKWIRLKTFAGQVTASPVEDRPRERLIKNGAETLRNSELIAILIRSGRAGESAIQAGEKIATEFSEKLESLPAAGRGELKEISSAVANTAYCQIMAGIELGRRVAERVASRGPRQRIRSSSEAIAFCQRHFDRLITDAAKEEFHIVCLDTKNQVIGTHQISVGTLDASLVHPREVFRPAIKDAASSILLVHNHPSGDPHPSNADMRVTTRLESVGETLGIDVLDHVVLGSKTSVSIREQRN